MINLFKKFRERRQAKYLEKLERQRTPLTARQFRRLAAFDLPPDQPFYEWMLEWSLKSKERQEREDALIRSFIETVAGRVRQQLEWEEIAEERGTPSPASILASEAPKPPNPPKRGRKKPLMKRLTTVAACLFCILLSLPFTVGGGNGFGEPLFPGREILVPQPPPEKKIITFADVVLLDGLSVEEVLEKARADEKLMMFPEILLGQMAFIETYKEDPGMLLRYFFRTLIVDINPDPESFSVFQIEQFQIRLTPRYQPDGWAGYFERFENGNRLTAGKVEVKYRIIENTIIGAIVEMYFVYGGYDYFLTVSAFNSPEFPAAEVNEQNLTLLIENLTGSDKELSKKVTAAT